VKNDSSELPTGQREQEQKKEKIKEKGGKNRLRINENKRKCWRTEAMKHAAMERHLLSLVYPRLTNYVPDHEEP
jgi:hypothetical protein